MTLTRFNSGAIAMGAFALVAIGCIPWVGELDAGADAGPLSGPDGGGDPCEVISMVRRGDSTSVSLSPDGSRFAENHKDSTGVFQVYAGTTGQSQPAACISCVGVPGQPRANAQKFIVVWHPSGDWLFSGVEIDHDRPWYEPLEIDEGAMQSGIHLNMYVAKLDGSAWYPLTHLSEPIAGYTGPAATPDGHRLFWAKVVDNNFSAFTFGRWVLMRSDFAVDGSGVPSLQNTEDVTPVGARWVEPGTVSADGKYLGLTLDIGLDANKAAGMDQWIMDTASGSLTNLTHSPAEWDEHGVFAPNSRKMVFMSSHPYPEYDARIAFLGFFGLKTEFMLVDVDGTDLRQLTHFNTPGYPEYSSEISVPAVAFFTPDGSQLIAAQLLTGANFPNQVTWTLTFAGNCGGDGSLGSPSPRP